MISITCLVRHTHPCRYLVPFIFTFTFTLAAFQHSIAQNSFCASVGSAGPLFLGATIEGTVFRYSDSSALQCIRASVSYGLQFLNAWYVPVATRFVFFHGSGHFEAALIGFFQVKYMPPSDFGLKDVSATMIVPGASFAYRFEPPNGGVTFSLGVGVIHWSKDSFTAPFGTGGIGYAW